MPVSDSQKLRILLVKDDNHNFKVSAQTWLLEDGEWQPGKGYFLTGRQAMMLGDYIKTSLKHEGDYKVTADILTRTQKYQVVKSDSTVDIEKWWRKGIKEDESWTLNKSLSIPLEYAEKFAGLLIETGSEIIFIK